MLPVWHRYRGSLWDCDKGRLPGLQALNPKELSVTKCHIAQPYTNTGCTHKPMHILFKHLIQRNCKGKQKQEAETMISGPKGKFTNEERLLLLGTKIHRNSAFLLLMFQNLSLSTSFLYF